MNYNSLRLRSLSFYFFKKLLHNMATIMVKNMEPWVKNMEPSSFGRGYGAVTRDEDAGPKKDPVTG